MGRTLVMRRRRRRTFIASSISGIQDRGIYKNNSDSYVHPILLTPFSLLPFRYQLAVGPSQSVAIERAHWTMARMLKIEDCDVPPKKIIVLTSPSSSPSLSSSSLPLPPSTVTIRQRPPTESWSLTTASPPRRLLTAKAKCLTGSGCLNKRKSNSVSQYSHSSSHV